MQPKRPRDVSQLAKMMIDMATGESPLPEKPKVKKNEAAVARGRLGGLKGGKASLHMMYYNFVRLHSKLRMSPAMAAGVSSKLWEIGDIVALVEAEEAKADRTRGPYQKKISD